MSGKEKGKAAGAPDRKTEIERLGKDVEELRKLAGDEEADAEVGRIRQQVAELQREFYTHLGPWQRAQIARHPDRGRGIIDHDAVASCGLRLEAPARSGVGFHAAPLVD